MVTENQAGGPVRLLVECGLTDEAIQQIGRAVTSERSWTTDHVVTDVDN